MKKGIAATLLSLAIIFTQVSTASAWFFLLNGTTQCQENGSNQITWTIDNTNENEAFTVTGSTNTAVVPVGASVPAFKNGNFTQTVSGTTLGSYNLTVTGHWPSDQADHSVQGYVRVSDVCEQPKVPETPKTPETHDTPTTPTTPQVLGDTTTQVTTTPVGSVNAGEGHETISTAALIGFASSAAAFAYGIVHVLKRR